MSEPVNDIASSPNVDPAIETAARRLLPAAPDLTPVGGRPFLVRTAIDGRDLRLRRWPDGTVPERVRFVHRLQAALAAGAPRIAATPYGGNNGNEPFAQVDGVMVDLQEWLPGTPGAERSTVQLPSKHTLHRPAPLSDDRLTALIELIVDLHERAAPFAEDRASPVAPVGQFLRAIAQGWRLARVKLRPPAPSYPPIQRWIRLGEQVLPAAERTILDADLRAKRPVVAHLSLWPAHVLVDRARVVGILDFSSAVVTTPLLDIAQIITRFPGWTGDHAERVLGTYTAARGLTPDERRALPAVAAMDMVIEAARLLRLGYAGELAPNSPQAAAARAGAQDLLNSIEAVSSAVIRTANPVPYAKRRRLARRAPSAKSAPESAPKTRGIKRRSTPKRRDGSKQKTDERADQHPEDE